MESLAPSLLAQAPDPGSPDPADLSLSSYAYDLPESSIAQRPVEPRHVARMLAVPPCSASAAEQSADARAAVCDFDYACGAAGEAGICV